MSMTRNEIVGLLKVATAYDGRERGHSDILAWHDSAHRAAWTYHEALDAIGDHFTFDGAFLTPASITHRINHTLQNAESTRLRALGQARRAELESPASTDSSADRDRVRELIDTLTQQLGWHRHSAPSRSAPDVDSSADVRCPHCQAAAHKPCTRQIQRGPHAGEHRPLHHVHASRCSNTPVSNTDYSPHRDEPENTSESPPEKGSHHV